MACDYVKIYKQHDKIGVVCTNTAVTEREGELRITNSIVCDICIHHKEKPEKPKKEIKPKAAKVTKPKTKKKGEK